MSRTRIATLAAKVADLRARRVAAESVPLTVAALQRGGFKIASSWADGLAVESAPGLNEKLDEIRGHGINPALVVILRDIESEGVSDPTSQDPRRTNG